jgi:hypothetical protein
MRVPTVDEGEAWVVFDLSGNRREVRFGSAEREIGMTLRGSFPGFVHMGVDGRVLALECGGEFRTRVGTILQSEMPAAVVSLGEEDVRMSRALAFVPFSRGRVKFRSERTWRNPILQVGEVRNGAWRPLETKSLRPGREGELMFQVRRLQEMEMILLCEDGEEGKAGDRVAQRLTKPWY